MAMDINDDEMQLSESSSTLETQLEAARQRATLAKTSRMLRNKLHLSLLKYQRGLSHVPFSRLEAALDSSETDEHASQLRPALLASTSSSDASLSASTTSSSAFNPADLTASSLSLAAAASRSINASSSTSCSGQVNNLPANARSPARAGYTAGIADNSVLDPSLSLASAASGADNASGGLTSASSSAAFQAVYTASPPHPQASTSASASIQAPYSVPPTPVSAPPTTTTFPRPFSAIEPSQQIPLGTRSAKRPRKDSNASTASTPRASTSNAALGKKRATTATPETAHASNGSGAALALASPHKLSSTATAPASGHRRKASQNTIWQQSRAILGNLNPSPLRNTALARSASESGVGHAPLHVQSQQHQLPQHGQMVHLIDGQAFDPSTASLLNGANLSLGGGVHPVGANGMEYASMLVSPIRNQAYHPMSSQLTHSQSQQTYPGGTPAGAGATVFSPAHSASILVTPRHGSTSQQGGPMYQQVPYTIAHPGHLPMHLQQQQFTIHPGHFIDASGGGAMSSQNPLQAFISPGQAQFQMQTQGQGIQPYMALYNDASFDLTAGGQMGNGNNASSSNIFNFGGASTGGTGGGDASGNSSHRNSMSSGTPAIARTQSALSHTPSDLAFSQAGSQQPQSTRGGLQRDPSSSSLMQATSGGSQLTSSQDSSLDTDFSLPTSQSLSPTKSQAGPQRQLAQNRGTGPGRPSTANNDPEGAAELMLFLAASPSPTQPSKKVAHQLGSGAPGSGAGLDSSGNMLMKGRRLFTNDGTYRSATSNGHSGTNPFVSSGQQNYAQHLAQPFEYQVQHQQLDAGPYDLALSHQSLEVEADYGSGW